MIVSGSKSVKKGQWKKKSKLFDFWYVWIQIQSSIGTIQVLHQQFLLIYNTIYADVGGWA